jgi:ATP-dependent Zn protease
MRSFKRNRTRKQRQKKIRNGAIAIAPLILASTIFLSSSFIHSDAVGKTQTEIIWQYDQLITAVDQGDVEKVVINSDRSMAIATTKTGEQATISLPNDPLFLEIMQENQVDVSVLPVDVKISTHLATSGFPIDFLFLLFPLIILTISIASTILWIWALVDCAINETDEGNNKLVWVLIIVFANAIGALLYLLIRRPERIRQLGH